MRDFLNLLVLAFILYTIAWFIQFELDPYKKCRDDPKDKRSYICEPFGFSLPKGVIDRTSPFPIGQGMYDKTKAKKKKVLQEEDLDQE